MQKDSFKKSITPIKIYVINLDRAPERWQYMEEQFSKFGLKATRVSAVDCHTLTEKDMERYHRGYYKLLSDSQVACFLSHRRCWQIIANGEDDIGIILEDDAYLSSLFPDFLEKRPWPEHIQLFSFEKHINILPSKAEPIYQKDGYKIYRNLSANYGAAGYMVTKDFAKILLKNSETFYHELDMFLFHPKRYISYRYNAYFVTPALCRQKYIRVSIEDNPPITPTYQEKCYLLTQKAKQDRRGLAYYWLRIRALCKTLFLRRLRTPIKIDFID